MSTTLTTERRGHRVAAYETIAGASMAVRHLEEIGEDASDVRIVPAGIEHVPDRTRELRWRVALAAGGASGLISGSVAVVGRWVGAGISVTSAIAFLVVGIAAGMSVGSVIAVVNGRRWGTPADPDGVLCAERYEVLCNSRPERIRHVLARWWDPAAMPARTPRSSRR